MFGNLAPTDILIILIVAALVFFGASKIPEIFRNMGKAVGEFKKGRIESEMEINQMQQAVQSQPQIQQNTQPTQNVSASDLEKQIKQLQDQLEQLKKQQTSQS
ncbi:twin-arginine translocase TatA/TatE family subunit [Acidianus manzaensis]|uniref:Preprotein translocase subunit TatA n=1 Tax=Acidianus manzaensis TaxID=282676 RepID=A0A1W6K313_9CREN|nr:twin-arginine translocase TatA/TatE family subunit [Acidianus manzaensis]ARM76875.1 preprotein translocase subunit TatA [Acidianus manzaensis]